MPKHSSRIPLSAALLTAALLLLGSSPDAWARAGGGGSDGGGGGILTIILLPIVLIYAAIVTYLVSKKNKECQAWMQQCAAADTAWNSDAVKARIEQAFYKIQQAWVERNQDLARDYMSERLYAKHKAQTDVMLANRRKNILDALNLTGAKVVQIADYRDNAQDSFWVYVEATVIDYQIDETTGALVAGKNDKPHAFAELWKFIRTPIGWVVDEIDQNVSIGDLSHLKSLIER